MPVGFGTGLNLRAKLIAAHGLDHEIRSRAPRQIAAREQAIRSSFTDLPNFRDQLVAFGIRIERHGGAHLERHFAANPDGLDSNDSSSAHDACRLNRGQSNRPRAQHDNVGARLHFDKVLGG